MLSNQVIGNYITKFRDILALKLINELSNRIDFHSLELDVEKSELLNICNRDISKFFLAIVSERPAIFANYVESVYTNRSIPLFAILKQVEIFKEVILSSTPEEMHSIVVKYISAGLDVL